MVGFEAHHKVIGHASASEQMQFGAFLETLVAAQHTPSRIFGFYGTVEFETLETSVLKKAAVHGEPITEEKYRAGYFQFGKDEKPHQAQVFGMCLNSQIGTATDLERRIFYKNPAAQSTSALESHTHALVVYGQDEVEVVHVLPQSVISYANVVIIAAE